MVLDSIANEPRFHVDMDFEPGDMQFLKNAVIRHSKTEYEDWDESEKNAMRAQSTLPAVERWTWQTSNRRKVRSLDCQCLSPSLCEAESG